MTARIIKKKKYRKINSKTMNSFGYSNCIYQGDNNKLPIGTNWIYHLSYCAPDNASLYVGTPYMNVKFLHVTAIYNVHAEIGLQIQNDIRIHYGYNPQNLQVGPMFWASYNWNINNLDQTTHGQGVKQFIQEIFNTNTQIIQ
tara:strand:+ start:198 stop:623 length:426 start_codon:yes stop_codon:yes gene_type:complete